jgi:hypothetical protein
VRPWASGLAARSRRGPPTLRAGESNRSRQQGTPPSITVRYTHDARRQRCQQSFPLRSCCCWFAQARRRRRHSRHRHPACRCRTWPSRLNSAAAAGNAAAVSSRRVGAPACARPNALGHPSGSGLCATRINVPRTTSCSAAADRDARLSVARDAFRPRCDSGELDLDAVADRAPVGARRHWTRRRQQDRSVARGRFLGRRDRYSC